MSKEVIISARHLKKVFGAGESEQVIYSDFDIDIYCCYRVSHQNGWRYRSS